jgi:hypothetical protein
MALVSSRTSLGVSTNVWRLAGDTVNITCNFLYCNHQVNRYFLIALYLSLTQILPPDLSYQMSKEGNIVENRAAGE